MASKKPAIYTRKKQLDNLLKTIFGLVKVNYTEPPEDVQILERSGLADKFTYESVEVMARSQSKIIKLFYLTFIAPNVSFEIRTKKRAFDREAAVENAKAFFSEYGVPDTALLDAETVYNGLKLYILPAIFETNSYSASIDFPSENIQERFQQSINAFSSYLMKKRFFVYDDIDQEECYFDSYFFDESSYKKGSCKSRHLGKCNFAIPITFREVFHPPVFQLISILIPFSPRQEKVASKEEHFQELVSGYIPISAEQHLLLKDHSWYRNTPEMGLPFTQSYTFPTSFPKPHDLDKNVYFLTRLDQSTVESLYENPQTHAELHQAILKRAQKYMRQQNETLRHIEAEWCLNAMTVIENTLDRVSRLASYREYLLGAAPDNQRGSEILSVFDIPENVLDFMHDYTDNDERWGVIFTAFDWAINAFFSSICKVIDASYVLDKFMREETQKRNDKPSEIAKFIRLNTPESERTRHIEYIEDILSSDEFCQAMEIQSEKSPVSVPILQTERNPFAFYQERISNLYAIIKKNLEQYLDQLL